MHNVEQMMLCDRDFHYLLARIAGNSVLSEVLRRLHDRSLRLWFISLKTGDHYENVQSQHEAILAAVRKRDPERAESAMRAHVESFRDNLTRNV